jgi:hypothetical protein
MITDLRTTSEKAQFEDFTTNTLNELKEIRNTLYRIDIKAHTEKSNTDYTIWLTLIVVLLSVNIIIK